ncbi:unnamed protein product [Gadus morhua 'NCC']
MNPSLIRPQTNHPGCLGCFSPKPQQARPDTEWGLVLMGARVPNDACQHHLALQLPSAPNQTVTHRELAPLQEGRTSRLRKRSPELRDHLNSEITWTQRSPGLRDHLDSEITWTQRSPGLRDHLDSEITWTQRSPGLRDHLDSEIT